jgi:hypothetical protein
MRYHPKMIAGASWVWWVGFHAVVALLLLADSLLRGHKGENKHLQLFAWLWSRLRCTPSMTSTRSAHSIRSTESGCTQTGF